MPSLLDEMIADPIPTIVAQQRRLLEEYKPKVKVRFALMGQKQPIVEIPISQELFKAAAMRYHRDLSYNELDRIYVWGKDILGDMHESAFHSLISSVAYSDDVVKCEIFVSPKLNHPQEFANFVWKHCSDVHRLGPSKPVATAPSGEIPRWVRRSWSRFSDEDKAQATKLLTAKLRSLNTDATSLAIVAPGTMLFYDPIHAQAMVEVAAIKTGEADMANMHPMLEYISKQTVQDDDPRMVAVHMLFGDPDTFLHRTQWGRWLLEQRGAARASAFAPTPAPAPARDLAWFPRRLIDKLFRDDNAMLEQRATEV